MKKRLAPLLGTLLLLLVGCESPGYKPPAPQDGLPEEVWKEQVHMSQAAWQMISVVDVKEGFQDGLMRVQVNLRNRTQGRQSFRTLFEWFDESGFKLDTPNEGWRLNVVTWSR
jgi:uncharacterized protein YcfL